MKSMVSSNISHPAHTNNTFNITQVITTTVINTQEDCLDHKPVCV